MATSKGELVLVTGAAGRTGRACIAALLRQGTPIRALVRRPEAAADLQTLGVAETLLGDLTDADLWDEATRGVTRVLHICPPMHPQETDLAKGLIDASKRTGVKQFVLYSVLHPSIDVPHHRRKLVAEEYLINSGLPYTILQPGRYMAHLLPIWRAVLETGVHAMPFSVTSKFSLVHLDDLGAAAALVLQGDAHHFATYQLAGPQALSMTQCAATIADVLGRDIRADHIPLDVFLERARAAGANEQRLNVMKVMNLHYDHHGLVGNPNVLRWLLGRDLKTYKDYVEDLADQSAARPN